MNTDRMSDDVHRQLGREALWRRNESMTGARLRESTSADDSWVAAPTRASRTSTSCSAFAADCWPDATGTRLYGASRQAEFSPLELQYLLNQKAQWWLRRRSWRYRGY